MVWSAHWRSLGGSAPLGAIHWSAPHLVLRWRCLGPWRTLDAPESPRVGCNCGLVALEAARCRLDSKYLESTSHLIQCVSRSESLSTGKPTAITYEILPKQLTTTRASAPPLLASALEQLSLQSSRVISKTTSILFNTSRSASSRPESPSNPSDLKRGS